MSDKNRLAFRLRVGSVSENDVDVRHVEGKEALSELFWFTVVFEPVAGQPIDLAPLLAAEACLSIKRPDCDERWVNGICVRAEDVGVESGRRAYSVTIAPKLALLGDKRDCRVFQELSAVDIVKKVLGEHGVSFRAALQGSYPSREMCVQYRESDLAFVARLLEEEGIVYWFEQKSDGHVMVLGDVPKSFAPLPGGEVIPYRVSIGEAANQEYLSELRCCRRVRPGQVTLVDFDFERPGLSVTAETSDGQGNEVYDHPSGHVSPSETKRLSRTRLEELRVVAETWEGEGTSERLTPGWIFEVADHPEPSFDVRLVPLSVVHEGRQESSARNMDRIETEYRNRFVAVESKRPYRPLRQTKCPRIAGPQTATVVGPSGEEVHPDKYGRVKVQFHWDRQGKKDDRSSAWVRLAQSWAGPGFGAVFVPRVGQEVLVRFLEGNPDRPMVMGGVYNAQNRPAIDLPDKKSMSTLKTDTSPHNGGSNELRFEDQSSAEQIYLHGQKDENIEVRNDKRQEVKGGEQLLVEKDRTLTVMGNQRLEVILNDNSQVEGNQTLAVLGERTTFLGASQDETISGNRSVTVAQEQTLEVGGASAENVLAAAALNIGGAYAITVGGVSNQVVIGLKSIQVGGARVEVVGEARDETVGGDSTATVGGELISHVVNEYRTKVDGDLTETVKGNTDIEAKEPLFITSKDGKLEADKLTIVVGEKVALTMDKSGTIQLFGQTVSLGESGVTLSGASVKLIAPGQQSSQKVTAAKAKELEKAGPMTVVTVKDTTGQPVRNLRWIATQPDGSKRRGKTDGQGKVLVPFVKKGEVKVTFPGLDKKSVK